MPVVAGVRIDDWADRLERDLRRKRDCQVAADPYYRDCNLTGAPAPQAGESVGEYRRRLLEPLMRFAPKWREALPGARDDVLALAERDVFEAVRKAAENPTLGKDFRPGGELRERKVKDEAGREWTTFSGSPASWMDQFKRPLQFARRGILINGKGYGER